MARMSTRFESEHLDFFDRAIDMIREHPSYAKNMAAAAEADQQLILNYHTHGPDQSYCASISVRDFEVVLLGLQGDLRELVHLRGVGQTEDECRVLMSAFAARLVARYEFSRVPEIWLNGAPLPA